MHPNFIALLFLLAFANEANAERTKEGIHGHFSNLTSNIKEEFQQGKEHLANIKNEAHADIHKFITKLTEKDGKEALERAKIENKKELDNFKKAVKDLTYSADVVGMPQTKVLIQKWLDNSSKDSAAADSAETLLKIFEYLVGLDSVPICIANQFLHSIDPKNLIIGQIGKKVPVVGDHQKQTADRMAFIFSQTSVRQLNIDGDEGIECKESLKEGRNVARLFHEIVVALEEEEKASGKLAKNETKSNKNKSEFDTNLKKLACSNKIKVVLNHLEGHFQKEGDKVHALVEIVQKKISKWETIGNRLEKLDGHLKDYAVFLLKPANFQYFLTAVISIAKLSGTMTLAVTSIRAFGLDELLTKELQHIVPSTQDCGGAVCKLDLWLFDVNGVVPLYLRGYSVDENKVGHNVKGKDENKAEPQYYDHNGKEYIFKEGEQNKHNGMDDEKFIKTIVTELIEHKGLAFEHIMQKTMEKLASIGDGNKWKERAVEFKKGWEKTKTELATFKQNVKEIDPHKVLTSVENAAKDITLFLITPRHIAYAFKLILTIFGLYTPVYISLEVLQLLGITDVVIEIMKVSEESIKQVNGVRKGGKTEGAMDFMFSENGVVPMLLTMGKEEDTKKRRLRVANELEMFSLIKEAVIQHDGDSLKELYDFFVNKIKQNSIGLDIVQAFQKQETSHGKQKWNTLRREGDVHVRKFNAQRNWKLVFERAEKIICHSKENQERLEKFDDEISSAFMKDMEDVTKLKVERGDCKALLENANNGTKVESQPKNHPKDAAKKR